MAWINNPHQGGGEMIKDDFRKTTYAGLHKFGKQEHLILQEELCSEQPLITYELSRFWQTQQELELLEIRNQTFTEIEGLNI
jgi:hypothetical protein